MKKIVCCFLMSFLLVSCLKELDGGLEPGRLDFRVSLESFSQSSTKAGEPVELKGGDVKMYLIPEVKEWSAPATKGTILEDASSVEGFYLYGFRYAEDHEWTGAGEERNLFHGEYVSRTAGGFVMEQPRLWAASGSGMDHRFFAFAASRTGDISGTGDNIVAGTSHRISLDKSDQYNGLPEIGYAVSCGEDVSSQEDLLYALSPEVQYMQGGSGTVNLAFSHALTAVKFSVEDFGVPAVIKGVSVRNVYRSGVFSYSGTAFSWSPSLQEDSSYSVSLDGSSEGVSVGRTGEEELTGGEATFLMIPQVCPEGSEVMIEFEHDGKQFALYADLEGQVWQMGKEIEYKISLTDGTYHLDVSSPETFTQKGVAETIPELFNVKAYIQYAGGVKEALPWSVFGYSEDGGTTWSDERPVWLTALTESGSGNYVSGDAVSGTVVSDRDSYEALVRLHIDEHTSTYVDVMVEKQGEEPLTFTIVTGGNIVWKCSYESYSSTIKYKKNTDDWVEIESTLSGVPIPVEAGDVLKFKGVNWSTSNFSNFSNFSSELGCTFEASGSVMSLIPSGSLENSSLSRLFSGCVGLLTAPELPATTLSKNCYSSMFSGCTGLSFAPELPATSLASGCYSYMFSGCTGLTDAPELPATILAAGCYSAMFYRCTGLTAAPELPATTLASDCYNAMFYGCTGMTAAPQLLATSLADYCYYSMFYGCTALTSASDLPATTLATQCYYQMFQGCTGLTSAPELPATTLATQCYENMFSGCTGLTSAPNLPATTLATGCYRGMFAGCLNLEDVPNVLPALSLFDDCYNRMFYSCSNLKFSPDLPAISVSKRCYSEMFSRCGNLLNGPDILPATVLSSNCYEEMFYECRKLNNSPVLPATTLAESCYSRMFFNCYELTSVPDLPATTLASYCYRGMFAGCSSLTSAPELSATTLASQCYQSMFSGCTGLTSAPELPAITLAESCYSSMFFGCSGLTSTPELPATTLTDYCYQQMFYNCTSLTSAPELLATSLTSNCYQQMFYGCTSLTSAPELPATTLARYCYSGMFSGCTRLTSAPELPATTLAIGCYNSMFSGCSSLTSAPELLASSLVDYCYYEMFRRCSFLSSLTCLATDITALNSLTNWLSGAGYNVSGTKTFYKNPAMSDWTVGDSGIPSGWTIVDATL